MSSNTPSKSTETKANAISKDGGNQAAQQGNSDPSCSSTLLFIPTDHPIPEFLHQLIRMLSDEKNQSIICWMDKRIVVHNPPRLVDEVFHHYFRHSNYASFQRQLNYFGFRKITARKGKMCPCSYVHDLATTDMRSLLSIRRRNPTDKKARNKKSTKKEQLAVTTQEQVTQAVTQAKQANSSMSQHQQVESKVEQSDASAGGGGTTTLLYAKVEDPEGNSTKNLSKKRRKLNSEAPEGTTSTDTCIPEPSSSSSKVMFTATPQENPLLFPPYPDTSHLNTTSLSTQNFCIPLDKTTLNYAQFPGVEIRCGGPDSMGPVLPEVAMSSSTTRGRGGKANIVQQGGVQAMENFMFPEALDFAQLTTFYNPGTTTTIPVNCSNNLSQQQNQQQTNCLSYPVVTHHKLPALYDETRKAACPVNPPQTIPSTITSSSSDKMTKIPIGNANNISIQINHNTAALDASNLNNDNTFTPATTTTSSSNNNPYVEKTSFEFLNLDADLQSLEKYFQQNAYTPTDTTDQYHSSSASMPRSDSCSSKESTKDATQTNYSSSLKNIEVSNNNNNTKGTNLSSSSHQQQQTQTQHHQESSGTANFFEPTPLDEMSAYDDILYPMYNIG